MHFWLLLTSISLALGYTSQSRLLSRTLRNASYFSLIAILSILTGLRDSIGTDYKNYIEGLTWKAETEGIAEPLYRLVALIVAETQFTEILFFAIFGAITIAFSFSVYRRTTSFLMCISIFIFHPLIYFGSLNLVRQFSAAALLIFSLELLYSRQYGKYLAATLLALSAHNGSIIFIALTPFLLLKLKKSTHALIIATSVIIGHTNLIDFPKILAFLGFYEHYSSYTYEQSTGISAFIFLLIYLAILLRAPPIPSNEATNAHLNMATLFFSLMMISFSFYPAYRASLFFILALPIALSLRLKTNNESLLNHLIVIAATLSFFIYFLLSNSDNPLVVPLNLFSSRGLID